MQERQRKILGISGSLRLQSSASRMLRTAGAMTPGNFAFSVYGELESIPPFDDSPQIPPPVARFIGLVADADAILFCIPEYAFGVPGALKNAMDWTVSTTVFSDKPVALITAASSGEKAHAAFLLTLSALGTYRAEGCALLIPFIRTRLDEEGGIKDQGLKNEVQALVNKLAGAVEYQKSHSGEK